MVYKLSLRDSISKYMPRGKKYHIRRDQPMEIESLRLEMLVKYIVWKCDILIIMFENQG